MPINLNDELVMKSVDKTLLLALRKLALRTEQHRTEVKQLQLKISIEKDSPNPNVETIRGLESEFQNLTRKEKLEAESAELENKAIMEHVYDSSERLSQIESELGALGPRNEFWFNTEAKNLLLCVAAYYGLNDTLVFLLENGASTTAVIDSSRVYPSSLDIGIKSFFDHLKLGELLAPHLHMNLKLTNKYPLELALAGVHLVTAEALVSAKANVNAIFGDASDISFMMYRQPTFLYSAAEKGDAFAVKFLTTHGADLDATDKYGNTALHRAAFKNHMAVVQLLLDSQANPNIRASGNGNQTAADFGSPAIKALIKTHQNNNCVAACVIM
ncbi:MAG: ankyrin repeat domain-containing protein [Legionella sp.]|nr:ankyrin repeat domain-containing protein [Legionella sp.]